MSADIKVWKISNTLSDMNNDKLEKVLQSASSLLPGSYLLDTMNEPTNPMEKFVREICEFHATRLNIDLNSIFVELFFKTETQTNYSLHLDCDEYDRVINRSDKLHVPFLSCITYLSDNDRLPTVISDVNQEMYKFKDFSKTQALCLSLPEKMKQICFNGGEYYHGMSSLHDKVSSNEKRHILVLNFWKIKPLNIPRFDYNFVSYTYAIQNKEPVETFIVESLNILHFKEEIITTIHVSDNVLSDVVYTDLLYGEKSNCHVFENVIKSQLDNEQSKTFRFVRNKSNPSSDKKMIDVQNIPKFRQRVVLKNSFSKDVCKWIINEAEEYATKNSGWTTDRHNSYPTTDLPVELMHSVFKFALISLQDTFAKEISKYYSICLCKKKYEFEINDIFIVKYEKKGDHQTRLEGHIDGSCLTLSILLSDDADFKGGGTSFEDGITYHLNQGDALIHSGKDKHEGVEISEGKRYLLVFFINIFEVTSQT